MKMTRVTTIIMAALILWALPEKSGLLADSIKWQVVSSGGGQGTSPTLKLSGTVGQTGTRTGSDGSYKLIGGFWQNFASGPQYLCGDADGNDLVSISDVVYLITYIFGGGPAPNPLDAGDVDCNGIANISDAVYLINYIFAGGPAPCAACP